MPTLSLATPISAVFGIGPTYAKRLEKLSIQTVRDLLYHIPFRYEDWSLISPIAQVQAGEKVTIQGQITAFTPLVTKNGKQLQIAHLTDSTGTIQLVWFNQRYLLSVIRLGDHYSVSGQASTFSNKLSLISPEYETKNSKFEIRNSKLLIHTGRLVPVYPETYGVSSKWLRSRIHYLLEKILPITDWLEPLSRTDRSQPVPTLPLTTALSQVHFPDSLQLAQQARHRLAHDELLLLQLVTEHRRNQWQHTQLTHRLQISTPDFLSFINHLPFTLTRAQNRTVQEILSDLSKPKPMNRLLEGDVGSGKTIVAAIAAYAAHLSGFQTAFMAPTEILAQQHFATLTQFLEPFGITVALQTGRSKHFSKNSKLKTKNSKLPHVVVGTHALLTDLVQMDKLALVVIDEQHRFGVEQRAQLIHKGAAPHVLAMTATPIPRTVALTLYGDLDLSVLDELPPGRQPVKTWLVPDHKRPAAYDWISSQLKTKNQKLKTNSQMFIVCPFIEPSESMSTVKAAKQEFEKLQTVFPNFQLGLLHGKLKGKEKDQVIEQFRKGQIDILVSTPVVEVGVDIPNATIMVIEAADRFGLAQLHQLRGRVGRASQQSYCLLFTDSSAAATSKRLRAMETCHSGLQLAELDLQMRGPGQIYGTSQHGFLDLKIASYTDTQLIHQTRETAKTLFSQLDSYPDLRKQLEHRTIPPIEPN